MTTRHQVLGQSGFVVPLNPIRAWLSAQLSIIANIIASGVERWHSIRSVPRTVFRTCVVNNLHVVK